MRMCDVEGCPNIHRATGLCSTHYAHVWHFERGQRGGGAASEPAAEEWTAWEAVGLGALVGGAIVGVGFEVSSVVVGSERVASSSEQLTYPDGLRSTARRWLELSQAGVLAHTATVR